MISVSLISPALLTLAALYLLSPFYRGDKILAWTTLILMAVGALFRARILGQESPINLSLAVAAFILPCIMLSPMRIERWVPRLTWPIWLMALGVMASLLVFGIHYRGGIYLPGRLNPTEIAKPLLAISLACYLHKNIDDVKGSFLAIPTPSLRGTLSIGFIWGLPLILGVLVRDLGLVLLLCLTLVFVLATATRRVGWIAIGALLWSGATLAISCISATASRRVEAWLNPFAHELDSGWQILQSLCALYSGYIFGAGYNQGSPQFIPIVESDFIYSAWAEEFGLVGSAMLLSAYWIIVWRGVNAGKGNPLSHLISAALSATIVSQVILNVGGVIKALPMTGITLPFISLGGASLLSMALTCGILCAISKKDPPAPTKKHTKKQSPRTKKAPSKRAKSN